MVRVKFRVVLPVAIRILLVGVVIAALLNAGIPRARATAVKLSLKSESQIRSEANLYDTAIREISRIETMKLATADDFKPVKAILDRQIPNLRFNRSKLVVLGLSESSFVSAAKARTGDDKKAEEFARELATDNQSIFKLSGAQSLKDKIDRSVASDVTMLRRVADTLKRSSDQIKAKSHHATLPALGATYDLMPNHQKDDLRNTLAAIVVTSLLVSVVMIVGPLLAIPLAVMAAAAVGGVYAAATIAGAAFIVVRVTENVGTEQGRDKIAACLDRVNAEYAGCCAFCPCMIYYLEALPFCLLTN